MVSSGTADYYVNSVHIDANPYTSPYNNTLDSEHQKFLPVPHILLRPYHEAPVLFVILMHVPQLVLAMGSGNPPAVWCLPSGLVWFGPRPGQKPNLLCLGRVVTQTGHKPAVFCLGWNWPAVPYYSSYNFGSTLASIKFLGSDWIMTWWVRLLCSFGSSFTSRIQNCNAINLR